jgi:hypothetical protein
MKKVMRPFKAPRKKEQQHTYSEQQHTADSEGPTEFVCERWVIKETEIFAVHHKKHIKKLMAHATVGYCFTGGPANGGEGFLIQLQRCQAYKAAQKGYRGKGGRLVKKRDLILRIEMSQGRIQARRTILNFP